MNNSFQYVFHSPKKPDEHYIQSMFDNMAERYDTFNSWIGLGMAQKLRSYVLSSLKPEMRVLDVACGTGDLALTAIQKLNFDGEVVGLDFSAQMLKVAQLRFDALGLSPKMRFRLVHEKAENIRNLEGSFDLIVSAYALRNLYENIDSILGQMYEGLKPGGTISLLDITLPQAPLLRGIWKFYMTFVVGIYGAILFGKNYPIPYLPDSADRFLQPHALEQKILQTGFKSVRVRTFVLGSVTLYQARK